VRSYRLSALPSVMKINELYAYAIWLDLICSYLRLAHGLDVDRLFTRSLAVNRNSYAACNFNCCNKSEGLFKIRQSRTIKDYCNKDFAVHAIAKLLVKPYNDNCRLNNCCYYAKLLFSSSTMTADVFE